MICSVYQFGIHMCLLPDDITGVMTKMSDNQQGLLVIEMVWTFLIFIPCCFACPELLQPGSGVRTFNIVINFHCMGSSVHVPLHVHLYSKPLGLSALLWLSKYGFLPPWLNPMAEASGRKKVLNKGGTTSSKGRRLCLNRATVFL